MTKADEVLWLKLRKKQINDLYYRRQHPYGMYILDFCCDKAKLVTEVDGKIHDHRKEYDKRKDEFIKLTVTNVLRYTNEQVSNNIENVLEQIKVYLNNMHSNAPSTLGIGREGIKCRLLIIHKSFDNDTDSFSYMGSSADGICSDDGMIVFGFGRTADSKPFLYGSHIFYVGFIYNIRKINKLL